MEGQGVKRANNTPLSVSPDLYGALQRLQAVRQWLCLFTGAECGGSWADERLHCGLGCPTRFDTGTGNQRVKLLPMCLSPGVLQRLQAVVRLCLHRSYVLWVGLTSSYTVSWDAEGSQRVTGVSQP
jgi:hypothetical protein